jgi:hypothetical protein
VPPRRHRVAAKRGAKLHVQLRATGGHGRRVWTATHLPRGIHVNKHGLLTGKVDWLGTRTISVAVTSGTGRQRTRGTMKIHLVGTRRHPTKAARN